MTFPCVFITRKSILKRIYYYCNFFFIYVTIYIYIYIWTIYFRVPSGGWHNTVRLDSFPELLSSLQTHQHHHHHHARVGNNGILDSTDMLYKRNIYYYVYVCERSNTIIIGCAFIMCARCGRTHLHFFCFYDLWCNFQVGHWSVVYVTYCTTTRMIIDGILEIFFHLSRIIRVLFSIVYML